MMSVESAHLAGGSDAEPDQNAHLIRLPKMLKKRAGLVKLVFVSFDHGAQRDCGSLRAINGPRLINNGYDLLISYASMSSKGPQASTSSRGINEER